jgi:hypothetical protein
LFLQLIGVKGDQNLGLKYLYECINTKVGVRVPFALLFVLFWLLIYIPEFVPGKKHRFKEAADLIRYGLHYYPDSVLFIWLDSYANLKEGRLTQSTQLLDKAHSIGVKIKFIKNNKGTRLHFEKGWCFFLLFQWEDALKYLEYSLFQGESAESFDKESTYENARPFTLLLIAIASCMQGKLQSAQIWLQRVCNNKNKIQSDKWIFNRGQMYAISAL